MAVEAPVESLEAQIERIALDHGIDHQHLKNLVKCESNFDPKADNGEDRGIVQINRKAWPNITDEQAFDVEFSLNFAAEKIAEGKGYLWTCGNCYSTIKLKIAGLPRMTDIQPTSNIPRIGSIAVFDYDGKKHVGIVMGVSTKTFSVFEGNKHAYLIETNSYSFDDSNLRGFVDLRSD